MTVVVEADVESTAGFSDVVPRRKELRGGAPAVRDVPLHCCAQLFAEPIPAPRDVRILLRQLRVDDVILEICSGKRVDVDQLLRREGRHHRLRRC